MGIVNQQNHTTQEKPFQAISFQFIEIWMNMDFPEHTNLYTIWNSSHFYDYLHLFMYLHNVTHIYTFLLWFCHLYGIFLCKSFMIWFVHFPFYTFSGGCRHLLSFPGSAGTPIIIALESVPTLFLPKISIIWFYYSRFVASICTLYSSQMLSKDKNVKRTDIFWNAVLLVGFVLLLYWFVWS